MSPDMRKKNGDVIWEDGTELEFKILVPLLRQFVSSRKRNHGSKVTLTNLKPQHKYGEVVEGKPGLVGPLMEPDPLEFLENWIPGI